ncbi:MAG: response regulator transcription factor [Bacteroidales bacterium]|jgi:DNA-binding response OmpR family regulator|nr:response regulator transcription factor [Bacteroidales bacterium]
MIKVIVFEKDEEKLKLLLSKFREEEILCQITTKPKEVLNLIKEDPSRILVLNYEQGGADIAEYLTAEKRNIPFYFISERVERKYKIATLRLGAEDYIAPLDVEELILKVKKLGNRISVNENKHRGRYFLGKNSIFDYENKKFICGEQVVNLTTKENKMFKLFCESPNQLITRTDMLQAVWGENNYFNARNMDVYITHLRRYLKIDESLKLINHHGIGFCLVINEE